MSLQQKFRGTGIAIVTPFNDDRSIDWKAFERLINFWIDGKVEYLVALGTTGESPSIHGTEKQEVFDFVSQVTKGRVPLVAGIGGNDTSQVIEDLKKFSLEGYDAILSVSPAYNKPNQEGIFQHYKLINDQTPLPVLLYNVPSRTGQNMTADTQLRIARGCKNIIGTKEASGDFNQIMQIIKNRPEGFLVISGDDLITLPMIACGADGVISVVANAYPFQFSELVRLALKEKYADARRLQYQFNDIINSMFAEGSPSGVKAYLSELGLCRNLMRSPVWPVSEALHGKIRGMMKGVK